MSSNQTIMDYDYMFKFLLVGDSGVGKSCLLLKFTDRVFHDSYMSTIGVDFKIQTVILDGKMIKLNIWDCAGQERFRTITSSYYRGANGIIIVFDLTDQESFVNIRTWLEEIERYANTEIPIVLIGNKVDLVHQRQVSTEEAQSFADKLGMLYLESSAKTNVNVQEMFIKLTKQVRDLYIQIRKNEYIEQKVNIKPGTNLLTKSSCC